MKILALRVASYRRFSEPVAVEGMGDGVNVIAGANELGKSTLFHALESAFLTPHGKTGAALEFMRPRTGGEPRVDVDFEIQSRRYRIAKQFGRGKSAILSDLETGKILTRAGEAEEALARLIGASGDSPGRVGLVWVRQQRALLAPDPDIDPDTGKPTKKRGEATALSSLLGAEIVEAAGSEAAGAVAARVAVALEDLVTVGRGSPRKGGPYDLALKHKAACEEILRQTRSAAETSDTRLQQIASLTAANVAAQAEAEGGALEARLSEAEQALAATAQMRARRDVLAAERDARRHEAENARQTLERARQSASRRAELAANLAFAHDLETEVRDLSERVNGDAATQARLQRLFECERDVAVAMAGRGEAGASVEVALEAGGAGKLSVDGRPVTGAERFEVRERLAIAIKGIGAIHIAASGASNAAAARHRLAQAEAERTQVLTDMGAGSVAEAKEKAEARQRRVAALDQARARISGLAPKGSAVLAEEIRTLGPPIDAPALAAMGERAESLALTARAADRALEEASAAAAADDALRKLSSDVEALRHKLRARGDAAQRRAIELERLKGEQAGFDEDGRAGEVVGATLALERASGEVTRIEEEIAALRLLHETLLAAGEGIRARYFEPVTRALVPYLTRVFPGAAVDFSDGFSLQALTRAGEREEFATLSDGTREQLAVLVRMGFAQVLAERGATAPLILDDPLVYSDDQRLAAMCGALEDSGSVFQVILFTCREQAFQKLSGRRLSLERWRPEVFDH